MLANKLPAALLIICLVLVCLLAGSHARTSGNSLSNVEDWPGWRGPTRQGVSSETAIPTKWSETENVAWKTAIPGLGWSSPIVYGDGVFVTSATDGGASCRVIRVDRRTGKIKWDKEVFRQIPGNRQEHNSYATPTPVTDGRRVYAAFYDGGIAAVSFDGRIAWVNREHKYYSVHGSGASPILHDDLLIFPYDTTSDGEDKAVGHTKPWDQSFILALDKNTGKLRWKAKRGLSRVAHVTPQVMNVEGQPQLVSGAGDVVQAFDLKTGGLLWQARSVGEGVVPSVVIGDGMIFTASGFGDPAIRAVRPGGRGDVTQTNIAWEIKKAVPMVPSFVYVNGLLFTISEGGVAQCIKATTGETIWQQRIGGKHYASPIYADGKIYFLSEEGESTIIKAGPQFEIVASNRLNESCQASYAVSRGQLFIRTRENLYCIGAAAQR